MPSPVPFDHEELFECDPIPFLEVNAAGWFLRTNRAACNLFGLSQNELRTLQVFDLVAPAEAETTLLHFAEMLHGARSHAPFEQQFKTRHGTIRNTQVQPTALLSPDGVPRGFRLSIIDPDARKCNCATTAPAKTLRLQFRAMYCIRPRFTQFIGPTCRTSIGDHYFGSKFHSSLSTSSARYPTFYLAGAGFFLPCLPLILPTGM